MAIQILITDPSHNVVGDPLSEWSSVDVTRRFNEPASGQITHPAHPWVMAQLVPGNRVILIRDGAVWCEGPMEIPTEYTWDLTDDTDPGTVTLHFTDDLAVVAGRVTYADPAVSWSSQPANGKYRLPATNAETAIRTLVNVNAGPGAVVDRQHPTLALAPVAGVGSTVDTTTVHEPLLEVCRRVATIGGNLGFRTYVSGGQILFEVYLPEDKTSTARFARDLGNLRAVRFKQVAPENTSLLVAGAVTDAGGQTFAEVSESSEAAEWWRIERFTESSHEDNTDNQLVNEATAEFYEGTERVELATTTVDTEDLKAGRDFDLGDLVTVSLPSGLEVVALVRSIHLQATPESGEYVTSLIGSPEASTSSNMVRTVRELSRRLGRIAAR